LNNYGIHNALQLRDADDNFIKKGIKMGQTKPDSSIVEQNRQASKKITANTLDGKP